MKISKKVYYRFLGVLILLAISVLPALAVPSLVDTTASGYKDGDYKLEYIREYAIYIAKIILGLVGSVSLVAFVVGGVMFLISGGSQDRIKKGKEIITAAVVGIIITFSSVLIINLFLGGLGLKLEKDTGKILSAPTTTQ